jgi:hypothetical protein
LARSNHPPSRFISVNTTIFINTSVFENTNVSCQEKGGAKLSPNHRGETEMNPTPRRLNACTKLTLIIIVMNGCDNANSRPCWPLHPRLENRTEIPYVLHRQQAILIRKICKRSRPCRLRQVINQRAEYIK